MTNFKIVLVCFCLVCLYACGVFNYQDIKYPPNTLVNYRLNPNVICLVKGVNSYNLGFYNHIRDWELLLSCRNSRTDEIENKTAYQWELNAPKTKLVGNTIKILQEDD